MSKLVVLSDYGLCSNGGGVKVYTLNLTENLKGKKVSLKLLIRQGNPTDIEEKLPENKFLYMASAMKRLRKLEPDFILSQGGWFTAISAMLYTVENKDSKIIYLYHTHYDPPASLAHWVKRIIENYLMSFVLSRFDLVLFVSRGLKQNVEEMKALRVPPHWGVLYGAPSVKLPGQENVEEFKRRFKIKKDRLYLLGHGLTALPVKAKGAKLLIDALARLPDNVGLILTRKGRFVEELQKYAELKGVKDRVIFTGDSENPHIATLVADIYTHITFGEGGLSLALLEVMSIGKPVIASRVGGIPEAIRHHKEGILIENDVNQITNAVRHLLLNSKLRKKMSALSKRAVNKRFSWEKTADKLLYYFSKG